MNLLKTLIMLTFLSGIFGCNKNTNPNSDNDVNEINVKSGSETDSINAVIDKVQAEADSICLARGHVFEASDSELGVLYRKNQDISMQRSDIGYGGSGLIGCNTRIGRFGQLPNKIVDYNDRTEIVTTKTEYKFCYRCMRNIKFETKTKKVIWKSSKE